MKNTFKVGTSRFIALRDLQPHPLAQRALDMAHAKYIGDNFDPALMGELTVAETKRGRLLLVDGQHRRVGAQQFLDGDDSQQVLCRVIAVDDDAEAARLFLGCAGQIEAHHDDYSKPLEVIWVCRAHHRILDRKRRAA